MLRKNVTPQYFSFGGVDASTGGIKTGVTWTLRVCKDGTWGAKDAGTSIAEDGTTGFYTVTLAATDTNANNLGYSLTGTGAVPVCITAVTTAGDPTDAVRGGLTALPNAAAAAIGGLLTAPTTANVGLADLSRILGTALTETAGLIAAGFKKFFNVATPTGTVNSIPDVVPGGTNGLFIAGTNAATTVTTALTTTFTGNLTGSVASVGGSVGSVTGAVGSVTGAVGSVTGAVGSVTGNVGGNVVGTVAGVTPAAAGAAMTLTAAYDAAKTAAQAGDAMNVTKINSDATAAANLAKTTRAIARGTVGVGSSTTSIVTSDFVPTGVAADQFKGKIITFDADTTTTSLRGQSTDITASSAAAAPVFTVTALTDAPASGDTFSVT